MEMLESHPKLSPETLNELQLYLDMLHHHLQNMQRNIDLFAPWLSRLDGPPGMPAENPDAQAWQDFRDSLPGELPTLGQAAAVYDRIKLALAQFQAQSTNEAARDWCQKLDDDLSSARLTVQPLLIGFQDLAEQAKCNRHRHGFPLPV